MAANGKSYLPAGAMIALGIVLTIISAGTLASIGAGMIISGVFAAASIALTPDMTEATEDQVSPTYGFAQFRNPVKGDTPVPVIYSAEGHKTAPVWLQAYVTPRGFRDDDARQSSRYQRLSGLLAVAEGPIVGIEDIRFNDEPVFAKFTDYAVGTGTGSKKKWTLPQNKVVLDSVEIAVDGVAKGFITTRTFELLGTGNGTRTTWSFALPNDIADEIPVKFFSLNPIAQDTGMFELDAFEITGMQAWLVERRRLVVHRDEPLSRGKKLWVSYGQRTTNGVTLRKVDGEIKIKLDPAPASGAKITATFLRKKVTHLKLHIRLGGAHQLPIWGLHLIRNSFGVRQDLPRNVDVTKDTTSEVDDVTINLASTESGFVRYDDEGGTRGVKAQFKIEVKRQNVLGDGNVFDAWYTIPDPRGAYPKSNKNALEFEVLGQTPNQQFWSFSIRNLLLRYAEGFSGNGAKATAARTAVSNFTKALYTVRVRRTNPVGSTNNPSWVDDLVFSSITEIQDEMLSTPGTAKIGFEALGTERLNGGAPNVTCRVLGKRNVRKVITPSNTNVWVPDPNAQSNRVWAAVDLVTNWKYGAGEHYTLATNVDADSALECANWLDEQVQKGKGNSDTEARSRLDIVLDTRKSLLEHLRAILVPGRIWAVQRGDTWFFVKDDAVELLGALGNDLVPVIYDDTELGRTAQNTLGFGHDSIVTVPTEVQLTFLDETREFQSKQVWVVPEEPGDSPRRIRRVTATGTIRDTEVARYGIFVYNQLRHQGASALVGIAPSSLDFAAGDVFRIISNRIGINGWWRVFEMDFSDKDFYGRIVAKQYVPSNYAQQEDTQTIIRDGFTRLLAAPPPQIRAPLAGEPEETTAGKSRTTPSSPRRRRGRARRVVAGRMRRVA